MLLERQQMVEEGQRGGGEFKSNRRSESPLSQGFYCMKRFIGCIRTSNNLNQLHYRWWIHEMHANNLQWR